MNQLALKIDTEKTTQCDDLLEYLQRVGHVTPLEALRELGIFRLAARIHDLEKKGHRIPRQMIQGKARNGRKYAIMEYYRPER